MSEELTNEPAKRALAEALAEGGMERYADATAGPLPRSFRRARTLPCSA